MSAGQVTGLILIGAAFLGAKFYVWHKKTGIGVAIVGALLYMATEADAQAQ